MRVSIIVPTYNEAKNLPLLVEEIFNVVDCNRFDLELIIVDDNSPDGTGAVADELAKNYPMQVIHRAGKLGLGSAVRDGFAKSSRDIIGVMDADLSHDPSVINAMLGEFAKGEYDIVMGSRFAKGSMVEQWKWWRRLISQAGVLITYLLTGVKDPLSGFFFLRRSVLANVKLDTVGYKILLEILVKGNYQKVKEIPFRFRIRKFSTSKLDTNEYWLFLKQIIGYTWYKLARWLRANKFLTGILICASILLVYQVAYRTFWSDEMAVLDYIKENPIDFLVNYWRRPDNHPPLYYFLVLLVNKILPGSEFSIRLVSLLSGLGIVYLVYVFSFRVSGEKKIALLAAFFTALSAYFVLISQMARYHSLAALFSLLVFYFFYQLFVEGYSKRVWYWYLAALVLAGYTDYPHFFYAAFITNAFYFYSLIRHRPIIPFVNWITGQLIAAILLSPLAWMIYHRVVIQGDGGWNNVNLLANSWVHIISAIFFHVYSFFFGENIFPWNYTVFGAGIIVLVAVITGFIQALRKKTFTSGQLFIMFLSTALIIINTFFINVADPRYNFIVYPKFGFVAYPLWIMTFVLCLSKLRRKAQIAMFLLWGIVGVFGLGNFYQAKNYLNPSYFRTFASFAYIRDHAQDGQYLAITPNAGQGFYEFYKEKYFSNLRTADWREIPILAKQTKMWFFAAGSEGADATMGAEAVIPEGYKILERLDSVPLDLTFKKVKETILRRPSYTYKYSLFLLEKI